MKKDEIYKYGKILCCAAAGLAVLAVVLNKTVFSQEACLDECATDED